MSRIDLMKKIITKVSCKYGAPMGRLDKGIHPTESNITVYDRKVRLNKGGYDSGGAYWGIGKELRVQFTKDLSYIHFYRKN